MISTHTFENPPRGHFGTDIKSLGFTHDKNFLESVHSCQHPTLGSKELDIDTDTSRHSYSSHKTLRRCCRSVIKVGIQSEIYFRHPVIARMVCTDVDLFIPCFHPLKPSRHAKETIRTDVSTTGTIVLEKIQDVSLHIQAFLADLV